MLVRLFEICSQGGGLLLLYLCALTLPALGLWPHVLRARGLSDTADSPHLWDVLSLMAQVMEAVQAI